MVGWKEKNKNRNRMIQSRTKGMVHSLETLGCMDGPGLRTVVFLEGCYLRCAYCCNKDMLDLKDYQVWTPRELLKEIRQYKEFFGDEGGVTISGGDPVYQPEFVIEFLKLCHNDGIHTALDTSFMTSKKYIDQFVKYTNLFMISLKHFNDKKHQKLTGVSNKPILENILYLNSILQQNNETVSIIWFRYVILPNYTDTDENLNHLVEFLKPLHFEKIELLPYHKLGAYKWKQLGLKYPLNKTPLPEKENVDRIRSFLEQAGFTVAVNQL